jgi:hypothetical protein
MKANAWLHLEIARGDIGHEPLEFFYPFPKNSICMPHKKHSHFGTEFALGIKIYFENGDICTKSFPITFWRMDRHPIKVADVDEKDGDDDGTEDPLTMKG